MYCTTCGKSVGPEIAYCPNCGGAQASKPEIRPKRQMYRPRRSRKIAGVCLGLAEYLEIDVTLVRVVWVIVALLGGGGLLAYGIAWLVMPNEEDAQAGVPLHVQPLQAQRR